jgi:anti-sigma B factor antagonist
VLIQIQVPFAIAFDDAAAAFQMLEEVNEKQRVPAPLVNSLFLEGHRQILLNLKDVSQIDTTGIAAITHVRAAAERHRGTMKLLNLPRRIHDLLVITKLITFFEVFESEEDARATFSHADV